MQPRPGFLRGVAPTPPFVCAGEVAVWFLSWGVALIFFTTPAPGVCGGDDLRPGRIGPAPTAYSSGLSSRPV